MWERCVLGIYVWAVLGWFGNSKRHTLLNIGHVHCTLYKVYMFSTQKGLDFWLKFKAQLEEILDIRFSLTLLKESVHGIYICLINPPLIAAIVST